LRPRPPPMEVSNAPHPTSIDFGKTLSAIPPFSGPKMISEANVRPVHHPNYYFALLYCKTDLKLLRNSTGAILVGM
jgi:hypothetical protein